MTDALTGGGEGNTPLHAEDLDGLRLTWISTQGALDEAEAQNLLEGRQWAFIRRRHIVQLLDDRWLFLLHAKSFGAVWTWAGEPRRREMSIGIAPVEVARATRDALRDAAAQLDADTDGSRRIEILAALHHRLTVVHPFGNGNGRTLRLHTDLLARATDTAPPTWGLGGPNARDRYLAALRDADRGNPAHLRAFIWS